MSTAIKSHDSTATTALDALRVNRVATVKRDGTHHVEVFARSGKFLGTVEPEDTEDGLLYTAVTSDARTIAHYVTPDLAALAVVKMALDS